MEREPEGLQPQELVKRYIRDGRLRTLPAKRSKRLVVLAWVASHFKPGVLYPESAVNRMLSEIFDDYALLRRELYDAYLMDRDERGYRLRPSQTK